jgi:hypothetical protein
VLDVSSREDANRTAAGHAGANLGLVRRVAGPGSVARETDEPFRRVPRLRDRYSRGDLHLEDQGIEPTAKSSEDPTLFGCGGAESGEPTSADLNIDSGLAALIDAWPTLAEPIRAGILALVRAAGG